MHFAIDAATNISFCGERFLHAYVLHKFSGQVVSQFSLVARARQFSSFILLVGKILSADKFDPKAAIIIQNKDDLKIPLMLEQVDLLLARKLILRFLPQRNLIRQ